MRHFGRVSMFIHSSWLKSLMSSVKAALTESHLTFLRHTSPHCAAEEAEQLEQTLLVSWPSSIAPFLRFCSGLHSFFTWLRSKSLLILTVVNLPPLSMIGLEKSMGPIVVVIYKDLLGGFWEGFLAEKRCMGKAASLLTDRCHMDPIKAWII